MLSFAGDDCRRFTADGQDGDNDPIAQLTEMQCTWFEMEEARVRLLRF
jgi:hypothetical protein